VVGDQHRRAGRPGLLEAAAAVGEYDGPTAGRGRGADAVHDGRDALALVVVGAAEEDQQMALTRADAADPAGVAGHRRGGEPGQVGRSHLDGRLAEGVDGGEPSRPEHERDVVMLGPGQLGEPGGGRLGLLRVVHGRHPSALPPVVSIRR